MTKKEFKELCDFGHVYGRGRTRINSIYVDWVSNEFGTGFKYAVATSVENCTKAELFDFLYNWIQNGVYLPYFVYSRFAQYDKERFKVPIGFDYKNWN